jgi:hypothetical protein
VTSLGDAQPDRLTGVFRQRGGRFGLRTVRPRTGIFSILTIISDPMFWLHHGMVDKIWWDWQQKSSENARAFEGGSVQDRAKSPIGVAPMLTVSIYLAALDNSETGSIA